VLYCFQFEELEQRAKVRLTRVMWLSEQVIIRRSWNDGRKASVSLHRIEGLHATRVSGGIGAAAPEVFIHGYVQCTHIEGDLAHSCAHSGPPPHCIKICIMKNDNTSEIFDKLKAMAIGPE